jgi:ABC-type transport system involved in multi-copper enzyme maturation permease subunit
MIARTWFVFQLTVLEARRRRILLATLACGVVFLAAFATGLHFVHKDLVRHGNATLVQQRIVQTFFLMAGLYGVNFLTVLTAVLLPVDTLSGEIGSGVMQCVAAKPIRRTEIVLGKWLGHGAVLTAYLAFLVTGVLAIGAWTTGVTLSGTAVGLPLMWLEGLVFLTLSIAFGARFSTITNGILVFGLYGLAFIGNWTEQIGARTGNDAACTVGTAASLFMPTEALWQLAAWHMQPPLMRDVQLTPFSPASVPNANMVLWAGAYATVALVSAVMAFRRRDL